MGWIRRNAVGSRGSNRKSIETRKSKLGRVMVLSSVDLLEPASPNSMSLKERPGPNVGSRSNSPAEVFMADHREGGATLASSKSSQNTLPVQKDEASVGAASVRGPASASASARASAFPSGFPSAFPSAGRIAIEPSVAASTSDVPPSAWMAMYPPEQATKNVRVVQPTTRERRAWTRAGRILKRYPLDGTRQAPSAKARERASASCAARVARRSRGARLCRARTHSPHLKRWDETSSGYARRGSLT